MQPFHARLRAREHRTIISQGGSPKHLWCALKTLGPVDDPTNLLAGHDRPTLGWRSARRVHSVLPRIEHSGFHPRVTHHRFTSDGACTPPSDLITLSPPTPRRG